MSTDAVVIGLGSNLNQPIKNLRQALSHLKKISGVHVENVSAIYESSAQLPAHGSESWNLNFLNAAVLLKVSQQIKPFDLLKALKSIEKKMGRVSQETWAPRDIDLDILYWENLNLNEADLKIPHKQLQSRPFALLPLLDIYPTAKIVKPRWAESWIGDKPFQTCKSAKHFWPKIVGIVNLTTDSFSDGSEKLNYNKINSLISSGVDILDLGAQSTRPGAVPVDSDLEWQRLKTALELISAAKNSDIQISIDSYKPEVLTKCLEFFEIDYINDVSGFQHAEMKQLLKSSGKKAFVMHSLSVPAKTNEFLSEEVSPVQLLTTWWSQKKMELLESGVRSEQLIFDPGIGFGKTKEQNLFILKNLNLFSSVTEELLIGHSRKSYQSLFTHREAANRDLETALITADLNLSYAQYLRVHDIETQKIALRYR